MRDFKEERGIMGRGKISVMFAVCKTCGKDYYIDESEEKRYMDKGFSLPTHCRKCRDTRRRNSTPIPYILTGVPDGNEM